MGKTIEIRLSDAQHATLMAEAEASGHPFFGYCRAKLLSDSIVRPEESPVVMARTLVPGKPAVRAAPAPTIPSADDRFARLEDAVAKLTEYVLQGSQAQPMDAAEPPSVDDLVNAQFAQAEAEGLTEHVPDEAEVAMETSGVRPLHRRPQPFSPAVAPRHIAQMLG